MEVASGSGPRRVHWYLHAGPSRSSLSPFACPGGPPMSCIQRSTSNVIVGIIGTLFGHSLAFEIAMFRFVGVRNRVVGECQVVNSHCKMIIQLLEC